MTAENEGALAVRRESQYDWPWTAGVVGHGVGGDVSPTRKRPDLCAHHGHPGCTYHPQLDRTWCLCGERTYRGNQDTWLDKNDGPLMESKTTDWISSARRRDNGTAKSIEDTLWLMGSEASDLWPEKRRARRVLTLVLMLRAAPGEVL